MAISARRFLALPLLVMASACGGTSRPTAPTAVAVPGFESQVESVTDGDTIRINPAVLGAVSVRVFFSSTPEADSAGFRPCPADGGSFSASCFGPQD